jgi:hypothetical protein
VPAANIGGYSKTCNSAAFPKSRYCVPEVPRPCSRSPVALFLISRQAFPISRSAFPMSRQRARRPRRVGETGWKSGAWIDQGSMKTACIGTLGTPRSAAAAASGVTAGLKVAGEAVKAFLVIRRHAAGVVGQPGVVIGFEGVDVPAREIPADHADRLIGQRR